MKLTSENRAYLELHIAVILFGLTAILGDLIELSAVVLVWWRVLLTSLSLVIILLLWKIPLFPSKRLLLIYGGIGAIVGLHWITFYGAVKLSNASITLVCMATASFFTAFLEPMIMKRKLIPLELIVGLLIIPGMMLIVNDLSYDMKIGMGVGLISSFLAALFATLNKKYINEAASLTITFVEMSAAWLFLCCVVPFVYANNKDLVFMPNQMDWFYMAILVLLCTTLAYLLALRSLKHLSAFASNLVVNLEPVYGILLAIVILKEHKELTPTFYAGVAIIIGVVCAYPYFKKRFIKEEAQ